MGAENERRRAPTPYGPALVVLAVALAAAMGISLVIFVPFLQDWRALLVFVALPAITVALVLLAALKA